MTLHTFLRVSGLAMLAVTVSLSFVPSLAIAAAGHSDNHGHGHAGLTSIGEPGEASAATRTINITMYDNYYEPEDIRVKAGETVKFIVKNAGEFVHEFNIATAEMHAAHAPEMMMMMDHGVLEPDRINWAAAEAMQESMGHGMHKEANSALLEPGKTGQVIWKFPADADLEFACNVPGHYHSGMVGSITLE